MDYYDRDGFKLTLERFAELYQDHDYRRVDQTDVGDYWVSTVWMGMDHRFDDGGEPLIFETMVFKGQRNSIEDWGELYMQRYTNLRAAQKGHEAICEDIFWNRIDL